MRVPSLHTVGETGGIIVFSVPREMSGSSDLEKVIAQSIEQLERAQGPNGAWLDCFDSGVMSDAQTVISLHLLGITDPQWTNPLLSRIELHQRIDGSWGVYPEDNGDLSTTVECYYALELYNRWESRPLFKKDAKDFIIRHGGLYKCRNLTKMFLAIGGEIPWSWLPSPKIYSWMFAKHTPLHIWDIVMFTRLHIPPMLILSSLGYVSDAVKRAVLGELLTRTTYKGRMNQHKSQHRLQSWQRERLSRCIEFMLGERESDGTAAGYHSSTFLILHALKALGYSLTSSAIQSPLQAMKRNVHFMIGTDTAHQQTCNGAVWNTALALNALRIAGEDISLGALSHGVHYLLTKQQQAVGEWIFKSSVQPGGWGFSSNNTKHPDTDDTVACLEALYPLRDRYNDKWWKGVNWLLGMQNRDGGWSAFEKNSTKKWLEWLPANDMKRAMTDPSTPDITGRVLDFLMRYRVVSTTDETVQKGVRWLISHQEPDGSWFGRWGTTYLYGTWCAIRALSAIELPSTYRTMNRAKGWLLSVQKPDGGFGESCESDLKGRFISSRCATPTQTAWGLDTLVSLLKVEESASDRKRLLSAADRAVDWLVSHSSNGQWYEEKPTGSAFPGTLHIRYHIYPKVWTLVALCHYKSIIEQIPERG